MAIEDDYTAYCLDEACGYIVSEMMNGKEPKFEVKFTSLRDMYSHYGA